jgi:hypothetical protein
MLYNCMNKDALLATGIGFLLGIIITSMILFGPKLVSQLPKFNLPKIGFSIKLPSFGAKQQDKPSNSQQKNTPTSLSITSPLPEALVESDPLLVSGSAPKGSTVVVGGEMDEDIVTTTDTGAFAGKITLREGKNSILITAVNGSDVFEQTITVYYTPEKF